MNIQQISKNCIVVFLQEEDISLSGDIMTGATKLAIELMDYKAGNKVEVESYKKDDGIMMFVTISRSNIDKLKVFKFDNLDNVMAAARLIAAQEQTPVCDLYLCVREYYLVLHKDISAKCLLVLHEFAQNIADCCHVYMYLKDYGQVIAKDCAIQKLSPPMA